MLKFLFHFYNLLLIILYIYPGSILGFLVYKDLSRQPQITSDFFSISSNHLYVFIILSSVSYTHLTLPTTPYV